MSHAAALARTHAAELRNVSAALPERFAASAHALEHDLGEAGLGAWARLCLDLARLTPHAPEVAVAFVTASPGFHPREAGALARWAESATALATRSPRAAVAFLEATPAALVRIEPEDLERWAGEGRRLCRGSWKSAKLAAEFFRIGPRLLESVSLADLECLVTIVARLEESSTEMATVCLHDSIACLGGLARRDRTPFLAFTQAVCAAAWVDTPRCLERGPALLEPVGPEQRGRLLAIAASAAARLGREGFARFRASAEALGALDVHSQADVLDFARRVATHDAGVALAFVAAAPEVRGRLTARQTRQWCEDGLALLQAGQSPGAAESYFRLESALAEERLGELAARVELGSVGNTLRLYASALSGRPLAVQPTGALVARNLGWAVETAATSDGMTIFLPPEIGLFGNPEANFQVYKLYTTHQVGRLEFGSYRYRFGGAGRHLAASVRERARERSATEDGSAVAEDRASSAATAMQRLLDLFEDRGLASELFALAEGTRIDACVHREYPGVRAWLRRVREMEAEGRPEVRRMALRQAFVENLLRASLGQLDTLRWPRPLRARLAQAVVTLQVVERTGATVQDAAEAAARLYDLAIAIPNLPPQRVPADWGELDADAVAQVAIGDPAALRDETLPEGTEVPYESPGRLDHRGDFKPALVQLLDRLSEAHRPGDASRPLSREQLLELLERGVEIELAEADEAADALPPALDALLANLEAEARVRAAEAAEGNGVEADAEEAIAWFHYDEWDFRARDYRRDWCRLGERTGPEGELEFYAETLRRYHGLVVETRRQFEQMRPESFRRIKRLEDGHEIDLDQSIEFHADKRAGAGPLARFYTRRNKLQRDVAVAFLLDISGSTGEEIGPPNGHPGESARGARGRKPGADAGKRIIDIERESAVVLIEALEAIGDAYALYAFSGHGRENVEFYVIKALDEPLDDAVRRRIDKLEPRRSTRMGPAIRHALTRLDAHEARVKLLVLVSDGRPQDEGYGRERADRDYAVHDTRQALLEARRKRINPFLITVDRAGHDYLRHMCDDMGYMIVADIDSLPRRLPKLYRHLAGE